MDESEASDTFFSPEQLGDKTNLMSAVSSHIPRSIPSKSGYGGKKSKNS